MPARSRRGQRAAPIESPNTTSSYALKKNWAQPRFIPANRRSGSRHGEIETTRFDDPGWLGLLFSRRRQRDCTGPKTYLQSLIGHLPEYLIHTSGSSVGLPEGQMGNSEVGHMNMGAGRVIFMDVTRIDQSIASGEFFQNSA